jgi:hypothetical protein
MLDNTGINWRIYYADGTTFDSSQGEPEDAPATRVIIIVQRHEDPQEHAYFVWMNDYYVWRNGRWYAVDYLALTMYWFIEKYDHPRASMAGETVANDVWQSTMAIAKEDRDSFRDAV